ncbi:MAG: YciI family protein [Tepidiformaceae bacterium]
MRYMALIYDIEQDTPKPGTPEGTKMDEAYGRFMGELQTLGISLNGERLQPIASATSVRVRNGKTVVTDGPFAETREQLGGFFILDCKDLDQALALAAKLPAAERGAIEIRPVWEM